MSKIKILKPVVHKGKMLIRGREIEVKDKELEELLKCYGEGYFLTEDSQESKETPIQIKLLKKLRP